MGINKDFLTPTPHPDYEAFTVREIQQDLERIDNELSFAKEHGAETLFIQWLADERDFALGELARRNGQNFTSDYKGSPAEVKLVREINAGELQRKAKEREGPAITYLPVLGQDGFIVKGWSHLLAAYPKTGKTEFLVRLLSTWPDEKILYITEEPESVWEARLEKLTSSFDHMTLFYGLGVRPTELLERIRSGDETVVVMDTVRNLLRLQDENDNSQVARATIPFVATAREGQKTLLAVVHDRKGGGEYGEGIAGGHAFLGVVDIALELLRENGRRRKLRGWGRVVEVPELLYELQDDNAMIALGSPQAVAINEVKARVEEILTPEFKKTSDIRDSLSDPKPSLDQLIKALERLCGEGKADRNPPMSEGKRRGKTYQWRVLNLTSDRTPYRSEVKLENQNPEGSLENGWEQVL